MKIPSPSSIRGWLLYLVLGTTIAFVMVGAIGAASTLQATRAQQDLYNKEVVPLRLLKVLSEAYGSEVQGAVIRLNSGELPAEEGLALIVEARDSITSCWTQFKATAHDSEEQRLVALADVAMKPADMEIEGILQFVEIQRSLGNRLLAYKLDAMVGGLDPTVRPVISILDTLGRMHLQRAHDNYRSAERRSQTHLAVLLGVVASGLMIGLFLGIKTIRRISSRLDSMLPVLHRLGSGDLTARIGQAGEDELGQMATGIDTMASSLRTMTLRMEQDANVLASTALELETISTHTFEDSKATASLTKKAAMETKDAALKLERSLDMLARPEPADDHNASRIQDNLIQLRNDNLMAIVRALSSLRSTAVQSARGVDHLKHKAALLRQISESLRERITGFRT